jgi:hypothetical protein
MGTSVIAIMLATCDELRRQYPGVLISLLSSDPASDSAYFGAQAIPRGPRGLVPLMSAARASEAVLRAGPGMVSGAPGTPRPPRPAEAEPVTGA